MHVAKTVERHGVTIAHGTFHAREPVYVCPAGCRQPGHTRAHRDPTLAAILPPRSQVGYDVMVEVGLERFVHHRQREEIRATLADDHGVTLSTGEISTLERRFLVYLQAVHEAAAPALRAALEADGGWPLHLDATCEDGRGTLLVAYTSWRHWALGAWKIPTERAEYVQAAIEQVAAAFGPPCGIVRDLGRAMTEAADAYVAGLPARIPILACHYHFLADVGGDLLGPGHEQMRALFRQAEMLPDLRAFVRQRGDRLGAEIERGREGLRAWLRESAAAPRLPDGRTGFTVVRALGQWVLDYRADGTGAGFPFDTPFLALYDRCLQVGAAVEAFLREAPADPAVKRSLVRLQTIVARVDCEVPPFVSVATALTERVALFTKLREALRWHPEDPERRDPSAPAVTTDDLQAMHHAVGALEAWLRAARRSASETAAAKDRRQAIDIILAHLERHGPYLWGHAIPITTAGGPAIRLLPRTNNDLEAHFHRMKHQERRRSGRKRLTHDFETIPATSALADNLTHADYVQIVCGSLQRLPAAFAQLDAGNRSRSIAANSPPVTMAAETASLSTADRRLVRTPALGERIMGAAQKWALQLRGRKSSATDV